MTVDQLLRWRPEVLHDAAVGLEADADRLAGCEAQVERLLGGLTADAWTGQVARATGELMAVVRGQLRQATTALDLLAQDVRCAGEALAAAQTTVRRGWWLASTHLLDAAPDGTVRAGLTERQEEVRRVAEALLREGLAAAIEADSDAAAALARADDLGRLSRSGWGAGVARVLGGMLSVAVTNRSAPPSTAAPSVVAAWWAALAPSAQRWELLPDALGRRDGLPLGVRDQLNRRALAHADGQRGVSADVVASVRARLAERPDAQLIDLDLHGSGRAVLGLGDVEHADHVAVLVPGMNTHVSGQLRSVVGDADRLRTTAERLAGSPGQTTVATVAWIGYNAPGWRQVAFTSRADKGAPVLRHLLQGIDDRATGRGADADLTVSAHSYGTLLAAQALEVPTGTDRLIVSGSPGTGVGDVHDLVLEDAQVFVDEARRDRVAGLDWFGGDPGDRDFGGLGLQNDGGDDPVLGHLSASTGHSQYYKDGSESLRNLALIVLDREEQATYD